MKLVKKLSDLKGNIYSEKGKGCTIGFVPTMGALHEGHLSLVRESRKHADISVVSIFVNPRQFNNPEDLERYPRSLERDVEKLETVLGPKDLIFAPDVEEMYPGEEDYHPNFGHLDRVMEGAFRPGHFAGVALVVKKLFNMVEPDKAFFGLKDYQQIAIIKKMLSIEQLDVEIIPCPIVRESNGLAMSSRNELLKPEEREKAGLIYQTLQDAFAMKSRESLDAVIQFVSQRFESDKDFTLEYFQIVHADTLLPVKAWGSNEKQIACIAVYLGKVRLIDNLFFS